MEPVNKQQIVRDFKQTFTTEYGVRVLKFLEMECEASIGQNPFEINSQRGTDFNLGKYEVYRKIKWHLAQNPDIVSGDSIIENEKQGE